MDAGDLVPDEVTSAMVRERLREDDANDGFLLDGYPRTVPQAETLDEIITDVGSDELDVVLELVVDDEEVIRRLSGRRTCRNCGHIWHVDFDPPKQEGVCDDCGGQLFQRDDDKSETVRHRLEVYAEQTAPLIAFYAEKGVLVGIDATGPVDDVTERAIAALGRSPRAPGSAPGAGAPMSIGAGDAIDPDQDPGRDRADARGGPDHAAGAGRDARRGPARDHHRRARPHRRGLDPVRGRGALVPRLPRLPGTICASIDDEVVHGIPSRERSCARATSSRSTAARSSRAGTATPPSPSGRRVDRGTPAAHRRDRAVAVGRTGRGGRRGPADRHQRGGGGLVRSQGPYGIVDPTAATASAPRCTRTRTCSTTAGPGGPAAGAGLALAIEPMVTLGGPDTRGLARRLDGVTTDGSYAAHWEHTVAITEDGPWVTTAEDGGFARLAELGVKVAQP